MPRCKVNACPSTRACYNMKGVTTELYCGTHRSKEMINVTRPTCIFKGCPVTPSYNFKGETKRIYCAEHKKDGMLHLSSTYCADKDCPTIATFNFKGKKALYCVRHKDDGMVDVSSTSFCQKEGCPTRASYNDEGQKAPKYCVKHKDPGMVDIINVKCKETRCPTRPIYNFLGEENGVYCMEHKKPDMVNVVDRKCAEDDCPTIPRFNLPTEKRGLYCSIHKKPDMINVIDKLCAFEDCPIQPSCNYPKSTVRLYCATHKLPGMVDIAHTPCKTEHCSVANATQKYQGYCYRCFIYNFPDDPIVKNHKVKEKHVVDFIKETFTDVEMTFDKRIHGGCSRRRPDIFIERLTHSIIIEVDENQHQDYSCENKRMMELFEDLGSRPIVFVRFNPDGYINKKKTTVTSCFGYHKTLSVPYVTKKVEWGQRLKSLVDTINIYNNENVPDKEVTIINLFYDENN